MNRTVFSILVVVLVNFSAQAIVPPKNGVTPPANFDAFARRITRSYQQGGLVRKMRRSADSRISRSNLYKSAFNTVVDTAWLPVLLGTYINSSATYTVEDFQALLFDGPNPTGTMTAYYREISFGAFIATGDVFGWYTTPKSQLYYAGSDDGLGGNAANFVSDLAVAADADIDFSKYDNDGPDGVPNSGDDDGIVDVLICVHTGAGAEAGVVNNIWSHRWSLSGAGVGMFVTNDRAANGGSIRIDDYVIQPELSGNGTERQLIEIGVFCHEFGHALGLPDLYDIDDSSEGVGNWCLMSAGSYGGNGRNPARPAHMSAWCKETLGWIVPVIVDANYSNLQLTQVEASTSPIVYKLWKQGAIEPYRSRFGASLNLGREYFLIENRQQDGFDNSLIESGLLIWHVDNTRNSNSDDNRRLVDLEAADGLNNLDKMDNRGDSGDPFPGGMNNRTFDEFSNPNSTDNNGDLTQVAIWNISDSDSLMSADMEIVYGRPNFSLNMQAGIEVSGNGNDRIEAGEVGNLIIEITNHWAELAEVTVELRTDEQGITITTDEIFWGTIATDQYITNEDSPFSFSVADEFETQRVIFDLTVRGTTEFNSFSEQFQLSTIIGIPDILLVDDDGGDNLETYFQTSLDKLKLPYDIVARNDNSALTKGHPYQLMIWFTGKELENVLTIAEQDSIRSFLNEGGRLLLTGQNIAEHLNTLNSEFLSDVLHVSYDGNSVDRILMGVENDLLTGQLGQMAIAGGDGARNQVSPDKLIPDSVATTTIVYSRFLDTAAAVRVQNFDNNSKIIFLGFGLEAMTSDVPQFSTREQLLTNCITWLRTELSSAVNELTKSHSIAENYRLYQNYPNPFNPETVIHFFLPKSDNVKLSLFNIVGQEILIIVNEKMSAGEHQLIFHSAGLSSGVYYYQLETGQGILRKKMVVLQ